MVRTGNGKGSSGSGVDSKRARSVSRGLSSQGPTLTLWLSLSVVFFILSTLDDCFFIVSYVQKPRISAVPSGNPIHLSPMGGTLPRLSVLSNCQLLHSLKLKVGFFAARLSLSFFLNLNLMPLQLPEVARRLSSR